ncbi:capZ-interacting protein [Tachyglossus aculeatus]|uniref:capZ-interacting protein n=1 Tax=Tachyglossus aculeatus TaxID=9261 RepID=UPI0018F4E52F|nr:capZ-interacting protein [Tachyglossus aculeatus]
MEERAAKTNAGVDSSASLSVAQLAGRFREQAAAASIKEPSASKPTRRKPPCSLPLFPPKVEIGQNGEEKPSANACHPPKIKVKSSPMIEKLQANLAFAPTALLPGASPKSPGLKAIVSPFSSPPSTPSSPGGRSRASESEEVPVSFDQPPEGSHLPSYNKVRTRGSIKRRPPSRRFRKSQSDLGDLGDLELAKPSQENGAKEESDEVFAAKDKAQGSPPPGDDGVTGGEPTGTEGSGREPLSRRRSGRAEDQEEKASALPGSLPAGQDNKGEEEERQRKSQHGPTTEEGDSSHQASTLEREKPSSSRGDREAEEARSPSGEGEQSPGPEGLGDKDGVPERRPLAGEEEGKSQGSHSGAKEVDEEKEPEGEKEAETKHEVPEGPGNQGAKLRQNAQSGSGPSNPATSSNCAEGPEEEKSDPSHCSTEGVSTMKKAQM